MHRIRLAMAPVDPPQKGGEGVTIEADETYIGRAGSHDPDSWIFNNEKGCVRKYSDEKMKVMTLVERGGSARSFHVGTMNSRTAYEIFVLNAKRESVLNTDEALYYNRPGRRFKRHDRVNHSAKEYVGGEAHANTVEGYYSIFKRGMKGVYQHCGEKHLHRYLSEFDFRYSYRVRLGYDDATRTEIAIKGAEGKRLTYRRTDSQKAA